MARSNLEEEKLKAFQSTGTSKNICPDWVKANDAEGIVHINADGTVFFYAPPWAAAFALLSWAGPAVIHAVILVGDLLALRYMARGWVRAGILCWFLLVPWEMAAGQINLIMAASIVAAIRGTAWPAAIRPSSVSRAGARRRSILSSTPSISTTNASRPLYARAAPSRRP